MTTFLCCKALSETWYEPFQIMYALCHGMSYVRMCHWAKWYFKSLDRSTENMMLMFLVALSRVQDMKVNCICMVRA